MTFETIARTYLGDLHALVKEAMSTGQFTAELSYHPILDQFFRNVALLIDPNISVVSEPRNQAKAGRPDWRFHNSASLGVYGYAEAKGLDIEKRISVTAYEKQINKYLQLGYRVILCDGVDFVFYNQANGEPKRISLVNKPVTAIDWKLLQPNPLLETRFRQFFEDVRFRKCSEDELIVGVAKRAKELSKSINELADLHPGAGLNELENQVIETLHELKLIVENHHDPRLRNRKTFADFVAQVLVFCLLYAHRVIRGTTDVPMERYKKILKFWSTVDYKEFTEHLRPFRALIELLGEELESLGPIGVWYQDCGLLLAHIHLEQNQMDYPDYHKLYEHFLTVFDPKTRFDYGAFYTPRELAKFSVELTQALVDFKLQGISLYEPGNKLIDPCCGTGTFLEQLIIKSECSHLPKIIGFEILPAPYALAHYRLTMLGGKHKYPQNLSVILTNTLSDDLELGYGQTEYANLIEEEQASARELSKPPLTLVIGNPPSSDSSIQMIEENQSIIQDLLEDFRPPPGERSNRQNIQKQLQNEFIKFLRWACNKLLQSRPGILTFVLPSSFAEHTSYFYARRWLVSNFPELWVLDLDVDGRTGARASSLFNTLQGRLLLVGFTGLSETLPETRSVYYGSITHLSKQEKLQELTRERDASEYFKMFEPLNLDSVTYALRPAERFDFEKYSRYWPLYPEKRRPKEGERYIFQRHCSALKLAPSSMFVHANKPHLLRRTREIGDLRISVQALKGKWFSGQDKPPSEAKFAKSVRKEIAKAIEESEPVTRYAYRPFTVVHAFISELVLRELARIGGGGTRYRPEVLGAFKSEETIGIAVAPAPRDIGEELHRFTSFCWNLPDNDLCKRGNAHVFCNQFPEYKTRSHDWDSTPVNNINPVLLERLGAMPEEIVYYTYGILCSDAFMDEFEGALFTVADAKRRPRIPFPASRELFKRIVEKGKKLAKLENPLIAVELSNEVAMFESLFEEPFNLTSYIIDETVEQIELLEDGKPCVTIGPVSREVLRFMVSGYRVLQQWLKIHSYRYTRAKFTREHYMALLGLLYRINEQIIIVREIDQEVSEIISGDMELL